jgi:hypothetical protein
VRASASLFLPAVFMFPSPVFGSVPENAAAALVAALLAGSGVAGAHVGQACLYQGAWDGRRMSLSFLVRQAHLALMADPAVLNYPHDALNGEAATWFINHRATLTLPLEPPLIEPTAALRAHSEGPTTKRLRLRRPAS